MAVSRMHRFTTCERSIPTSPQATPSTPYGPDVFIVSSGGRDVIVVGTAHVSQTSANLVRDIITKEQPDGVCVELDTQRFTALSQQRRWEDLDLRAIIRQRQLSLVLANFILASYQKRLGSQLDTIPGVELLEATKIAQSHNIPIVLCDRDIRVTMFRAWRSTSLYRKFLLISALVSTLFDTTPVSEATLQELRQTDLLTEVLNELGTFLPALRLVLIDERDRYMAEKIRTTPGNRLVVVAGAAHVPGICKALQEEPPTSLEALNTIPPTSPLWQWLRWGLPALLLVAFFLLAWQKGATVAGDNLRYWILANGIPSALGAACALAHPLTILSAFIAAPITSLTPVIGAGYVTAFIQTYFQPPRVREFQSVADDIYSPRQWWRNRLLRIFLAFLLPGLGSLIGTWIGGYAIISSLF